MPSRIDLLMRLKAPEITYFDHLYGEYRSFMLEREGTLSPPAAPGDEQAILDLVRKREDEVLTWNDLYLFELLLADLRPASTLRSKILTLRHDYRSIAGQAEYDEYAASKPKELLDPPDPTRPPSPEADYESLLREDLKDVLSRLYLRYAVVPVREARLKRLTLIASLLSGGFVMVSLAALFWMALLEPNNVRLGDVRQLISLSSIVVLAMGALGGFMSAFQRIQSQPAEGNTVYNLAMLYNGSYAVFVAPLTGAVFAVLLYLMFIGGILEGRFFPKMYTPTAKTSPRAAPSASGARQEAQPAAQAATPPAPAADEGPTESLNLVKFIYTSGPAQGADYALLMIWSFIAGFAERFVPDALNRLVSGRQADGQGRS